MSMKLAIVMYHYVRDATTSAYPGIHALSVDDFRLQLDYLAANHTIVDTDMVLAALAGEADALPDKAAWLTFDDGYRDHMDNVLPILVERGLTAAFFPPAMPIAEGRLLDVNKIHFIIAASPDVEALAADVRAAIAEMRDEYGLDTPQDYYARLAKPGRWDGPEVMFVKRALQRELPEPVRAAITARLFGMRVSRDEAGFVAELYMGRDDIRTLLDAGMTVGNHGYGHRWMDRQSVAAQAEDIDHALAFMAECGVPNDRWVMCYPYGAYDDGLLEILRERHCAAGVTLGARVADIGSDNPLTLPRLDTNVLPPHGAAL